MFIKRLEIKDLRNLQPVAITPSEHFNLICGANGSGKTSVLEALYILSIGRSFRTRNFKNVISYNTPQTVIFSIIKPDIVDTSDNEVRGKVKDIRVGLSKGRDLKTQIKINSQRENSFSRLANLAPVLLLAPELENLVDCSPLGRRQMIDWGLFHVEPGFHEIWKRVQYILKQRNSLLKSGNCTKSEIEVWDAQFVQASVALNDRRRRYVEEFQKYFNGFLERFNFVEKATLGLQRGWRKDINLDDCLNESLQTDLQRGFTSVGPHKANIDIRLSGISAKDSCSRGQKKIISYALKLAQSSLMYDRVAKKSIILLDDLASELDLDNRKVVCEILRELGAQVFVTSIEAEDLTTLLPMESTKLFHVKHGTLEEKSKDVAHC